MAENRELALVLKLVADQFQSELKKSGGLIGDFQKIIGDWKTQLTAAGGALFAIAKSTANYGDELVKMSQRIGVSIADTARLQHAAKLADTDLQGLSSSIGFLSKNMLAAAQGSQEAQQTFARLGISVTTSQGQLKGTTEILAELSERFQKMPDGPEKTALAMQALGKTGKDVLPFLNSQLKEAFTEAEQLGLVMSETDAKAAERFNDELTKLLASVRGLLIQGSMPLVQSLTELSEAFRTLTSNNLVKGFFRGLAEQTVLFSNLVKQAAANVEFLFGKLSFDELKTKVRGLEAEAGAKLLLLENPAAAEFVNGPNKPARPSGGLGSFLTEEQRGKDQERLGKAKLEIFLMQNRALEIQARLLSEIEDAGIQESLGRFGVRDAQQKVAEQLEDAQIQESLGRGIVRRTQELVAGREQEQLGRQIVQQTQAELSIREQLRQESMTFFDRWAEGMQKYVKDTQSGFGLSADMARRTFQTMEQGASRYFFDVMDGKITSLKDAFAGLLDFVKQIMSQIAAQLIMRQVASGIAGLGSSFLGGGRAAALFGGIGGIDVSGTNVSAMRFASGGSFMVGGSGGTDSQRVGFWATPGERVTVETPGQQRGAGGYAPISITVVNQIPSADVSAEQRPMPGGGQEISLLIAKKMNESISSGQMDKALRSRFGLTPGGH